MLDSTLGMSQACDLSEICAICWEPVSIDGDHQICALKCGHIFGLSCVVQCLKSTHKCPKCRKGSEPGLQIPLVWDGTFPVDTLHIQHLKRTKKTLMGENERLSHENDSLSRKKKSLMHKNRYFEVSVQKPVKRIACDSRHPLVLFEHQVNYPRSVSLSRKVIAVGVCEGNRYGLRCFDIESFCNSIFFPIHSSEVTDVRHYNDDVHIFVTTSIDKNVVLFSIRSQQIMFKYTADVPLWSVCSLDKNSLFLGGVKGKLYRVSLFGDVRSIALNTSNPIKSLSMLDSSVLFASSPDKSFLVDSETLKVLKEIDSQIISSACCNGVIVIVKKVNKTFYLEILVYRDMDILVAYSRCIENYKHGSNVSITFAKNLYFFAVPEGSGIGVGSVDISTEPPSISYNSKLSHNATNELTISTSIIVRDSILVGSISNDAVRLFSFPLQVLLVAGLNSL